MRIQMLYTTKKIVFVVEGNTFGLKVKELGITQEKLAHGRSPLHRPICHYF